MLAPSDCPQGIQACPYPKQCSLCLPVQPWLAGGRHKHLGFFSTGSCLSAPNLWVLFIYTDIALWDPKTPHRPAGERVSWCLETSPLLQLPSWDGSTSLTLLSLFLSFIFCPTSFWRQWGAFLGALCPLPVYRSCFVVFSQCSNDLSMNLWWRKWSLHPIPLPSLDNPCLIFFLTSCFILEYNWQCCDNFRWIAKVLFFFFSCKCVSF